MPQKHKGPGLKAFVFCGFFRGLKAPAPSEESYGELNNKKRGNYATERGLRLLRSRFGLREACESERPA